MLRMIDWSRFTGHLDGLVQLLETLERARRRGRGGGGGETFTTNGGVSDWCVCMDGVQIRFVEVSEEELEQQRSAFANGQLQIDIEETTFDLASYQNFLADVAPEARAFHEQQLAASKQQVLTRLIFCFMGVPMLVLTYAHSYLCSFLPMLIVGQDVV